MITIIIKTTSGTKVTAPPTVMTILLAIMIIAATGIHCKTVVGSCLLNFRGQCLN